MTITSVIDPVAGGEDAAMEQDIGGAINNSKGDTVISEDIGQLLPTEVSSAESDNFDEDEDNDVDQENENLLDEITEEDIRCSSDNNSGKNGSVVQERKPLAEVDNAVSKKNVNDGDKPLGQQQASDAAESEASEKSNDGESESQTQQAQQAQQAQHESQKSITQENVNTNSTDSNATTTSFRGRPSSCVFVASLAASLSDDELCISVTESFRQYGQLARVKVLRDPANRPYAFVQYTNDRDAKRALKMARGSVLNGRTLRCESARVNRTLFVTHVSPVYYSEVIDLCGKFGELEQLVPSNDQNQLSRRYNYPPSNNNSWFVQFAYRDDAIRAFANLRTNSNWDVEWVQNIEVPRYYNMLTKRDKQQTNRDKSAVSDDYFDEDSESGSSGGSGSTSGGDYNTSSLSSSTTGNNEDRVVIDKRSVFVGQLDQSVTREKLQERFSAHGRISDLNLINKTNKVFAFIQFETEEAAAAALERENHAIFLNKTMHVQYKEVGGHRGRRNFRKGGFYGNNRNNVVTNANIVSGNGPPPTAAAVTAAAANSGRSHVFTGPQVNLAPPPINMHRRRPQEGDPSVVIPPYMAQPIPASTPEFDMNYVPYVDGGFRRKSSFINNGWSSSRSHSMKSEMDTVCGDGATDATSDAQSEPGGQTNSTTTYNNSSAGSMGQNNNNSNSNDNNTNNNNNGSNHNSNGNNSNAHNNHVHSNGNHHGYHHNFTGKRRYGKRGTNNGFHDAPKPYYFQPYYYHPMHYPMGPLGPMAPAHPSHAAAAAAGNHPYMMIYPMPPPPPTGVDGNLLAQPLPLGPPGPMLHGSPPTAQSQDTHLETNEFVPNAKSCQLDY